MGWKWFKGKELWKANKKTTYEHALQVHELFFLPVIRLVSNDKKKDMKHNGHAGRDGVLITAEYWVQDYHIIWAPIQ